MKIEPFDRKKTKEASPLHEAVQPIRELEIGKSLLISEVPERTGREKGFMKDELESLTGCKLEVEYGDNFKTPTSWIVTKVA